ncbi:ankyrin repeat protein, partial [Teladorsagia circumcincta]
EGTAEEFSRLLTPESIECRTSQQLSLLHVICAGQGDSQVEKLTTLLNACGGDVTKKNNLLSHLSNNGFSALHVAVYKGDLALVKSLLECGADPCLGGRHQLPPLHLAAMIGSSSIAQVLLFEY